MIICQVNLFKLKFKFEKRAREGTLRQSLKSIVGNDHLLQLFI